MAISSSMISPANERCSAISRRSFENMFNIMILGIRSLLELLKRGNAMILGTMKEISENGVEAQRVGYKCNTKIL